MHKKAILLLATTAFLGGCLAVDPRARETETSLIETPDGLVRCQLYDYDKIIWDRAVDIKGDIHILVADQYCRDEGYRVRREGTIYTEAGEAKL